MHVHEISAQLHSFTFNQNLNKIFLTTSNSQSRELPKCILCQIEHSVTPCILYTLFYADKTISSKRLHAENKQAVILFIQSYLLSQ